MAHGITSQGGSGHVANPTTPDAPRPTLLRRRATRSRSSPPPSRRSYPSSDDGSFRVIHNVNTSGQQNFASPCPWLGGAESCRRPFVSPSTHAFPPTSKPAPRPRRARLHPDRPRTKRSSISTGVRGAEAQAGTRFRPFLPSPTPDAFACPVVSLKQIGSSGIPGC